MKKLLFSILILGINGCYKNKDIIEVNVKDKCPINYTYLYSNMYPDYKVCKLNKE